jgi:hypothetical protein
MFFMHYEFPQKILQYMKNEDLGELSRVNRRFYKDTKSLLIKRKEKMASDLMCYFHRPQSGIFSIHRILMDGYRWNLRKLVWFIPEIAEYIQRMQIYYLDLSDPTTYWAYTPPSLEEFLSVDRAQVLRFMNQAIDLLYHNTTLNYCNLGMFREWIDRDMIKRIAEHHPELYQLELSTYPSRPLPGGEICSLFRTPNGFEWRHRPPN